MDKEQPYNHSEHSANLETLRGELASVKQKIENLRSRAKRRQRPWYLDGSLLLAATAFIFTVITYYRQDLHETRTELRGVLKDLDSLKQENADFQLKFKDYPWIVADVNDSLTNEGHLLAKQAYFLAEHLGRNLDDSERIPITSAMAAYDGKLAEKLLTEHPFSQDNPDVYLAALRGLGGIQIRTGRANIGDKNYQACLDFELPKDRASPSRMMIAQDELTEVGWAANYMLIGECSKARAHMASGLAYYDELGPNSPEQQNLKPTLAVDKANFNKLCPTSDSFQIPIAADSSKNVTH